MTRLIEDLKDGRYKITESTGELHYTDPYRPMDENYRLFQGIALAILTQEQIDTVQLPHFNVDSYTEYPAENATLIHPRSCGSYLGHMVAERVARVKIAKNLSLISTNEDN